MYENIVICVEYHFHLDSNTDSTSWMLQQRSPHDPRCHVEPKRKEKDVSDLKLKTPTTWLEREEQ